MSKINVIAIIPARGGSKRFPGKNLHPLMGKPLIAHPIEAAVGAESIDRVIVSTDDEKIASVAKQFGAEVPFLRPLELASDTSKVLSAVQHVVNTLAKIEEYVVDYVVLLQATTPVISSEQIDSAVALALEKKANSLVAVSKVDTINHPYNIREFNQDGTIKFWQEDIHYNCLELDRPEFYKAANLWLSSRNTLLNENRLESITKNYPLLVPEINSSDIDYIEDLECLEALLQCVQQKKGKSSYK